MLVMCSGCSPGPTQDPMAPDPNSPTGMPRFEREVETILQKKIELVEQLARESTIVDAVRDANVAHGNLNVQFILRQDASWRQAKEADGFAAALMANACAELLDQFRQQNRGFAEIMVTDGRGLNVAITNRTSDYYQADEFWWQNAFDEGRGNSHYGHIEYDESAETESIALNVPVRDPETNRAIGVIKAVCGIAAVEEEL